MSQEPKVPVTLRIGNQIYAHAQADAVRRGCTVERWAEEVFEAFALLGYRAKLPEKITTVELRTT